MLTNRLDEGDWRPSRKIPEMHHARLIATKKRAVLAKTLFLAGLGLASVPTAAHAAAGLAPHRAVYDLKLAEARELFS